MKSWREKSMKEVEKQRLLDEIHQYPDVKKTFTICEIFLTIDWISNIIFFIILGIGIWFNNLDGVADISSILFLIIEAIGGYVVGFAFIVLKILLDRVKKNYRAKLQVLEDAKLIEIEKEKQEGTYQEGAKPSLIYRIYRSIRTWSTIIVLLCVFVILYIKLF